MSDADHLASQQPTGGGATHKRVCEVEKDCGVGWLAPCVTKRITMSSQKRSRTDGHLAKEQYASQERDGPSSVSQVMKCGFDGVALIQGWVVSSLNGRSLPCVSAAPV